MSGRFWVSWLWIPLLAGGVLAQGSDVGKNGGGLQDGGDGRGGSGLGFEGSSGLGFEGGLRAQGGGDFAHGDGSRRQRVGFVGSRATEVFDAGYYHLRLDVDVAVPGVIGATTIAGTVESGTLDSLALDFGSGMTVDSVWSDGAAVGFRHQEDVLTLALGTPRTAGERIKADVFYHGLPQKRGFGPLEIGTLSNGDPFVWSLSEPYGARMWWPSKDHPSDKADSVRVTVTVPTPVRVGSNGVLLSEVDYADGRTTFDWFSGYPISTYLVSVAGGVYDVHEQTYRRPDSLADHLGHLDLPVLHYAYAGSNVYDGTGPHDGWKHVIDILPVQEYWFGAYPFSAEKYGHAQFTRGGGMEHQTMSSMGRAGVGLIAHELAHQWFGDAVTMETWPHLWLNEGFATYAELLTWNAREHLTPGTYATIFDLYYRRALLAHGTLVLQDTTSVSEMFSHPRVYSKGAMVLHMLRGVIGDDRFRDILQTYASLESLQYGTATTEDFKTVSEQVSGRNLDAFFRQWVTEGTGYPVYDVRWSTAVIADGYDVFVDVMQTQAEPLSNVSTFVMPITIEVLTAGETRRFEVLNDQRTQSFTFNVSAQPTAVEFDPDRLILREAGVNTGIERAEITAEFEVYPNPARDVLHIRARRNARAELFDITGRRVIIADLDALSETDVDVSDIAPGFYVLRIPTPDRVSIRPIVILP